MDWGFVSESRSRKWFSGDPMCEFQSLKVVLGLFQVLCVCVLISERGSLVCFYVSISERGSWVIESVFVCVFDL